MDPAVVPRCCPDKEGHRLARGGRAWKSSTFVACWRCSFSFCFVFLHIAGVDLSSSAQAEAVDLWAVGDGSVELRWACGLREDGELAILCAERGLGGPRWRSWKGELGESWMRTFLRLTAFLSLLEPRVCNCGSVPRASSPKAVSGLHPEH